METESMPGDVRLNNGLGAWLLIETAPKETELLVGRWVNNEWRVCQSGFYFDDGDERHGEPAHWFWHCDWDKGGVTSGEGPTHWMTLPAAPNASFSGGRRPSVASDS